MKIIACVDDKFGLTFNSRRQSMDSVLRQEIFSLTKNCKLFMNAYSFKQFASDSFKNIKVCENFLEIAETNDYCFVENLSVMPYNENVNEIILFKWNRTYPNDFELDLIPQNNGYTLSFSKDFKGSSHDKITLEIYNK